MEVYVFDGFTEEIRAVATVDDMISLIWTDRHIERGDFELTIKNTATNLANFKRGNLLKIEQSEFTMIIEVVDRAKGLLKLSGRDLGSLLDRRLVLTTYATKPKLTDYIAQLVQDNMGEHADLPERRIPYLFPWFNAPSGFKKQSDYDQTEYGENLLEAVTKICKEVDLGFRLDLERPRFGFWLYYGIDRTTTKNPIILRTSDDTATDLHYLVSDMTEKNVAYVNLPPQQGEGLGEVKKVVRADGVWNQNLPRRELWVDASQLRQDPKFSSRNKASMLTSYGRKALAENKRVNGMDFQLSPLAPYKYRKNYYMGDILGVIAQGETRPVKYQVSEYIHSYEKGTLRSYPTLTLYDPDR